MVVSEADAQEALVACNELVEVVLEFGTKFMENATVAFCAQDEVPKVDPVC
jgi:hypothetical protein